MEPQHMESNVFTVMLQNLICFVMNKVPIFCVTHEFVNQVSALA